MFEQTEEKIADALGVGEKWREVTKPAEPSPAEGGNDQELTDPEKQDPQPDPEVPPEAEDPQVDGEPEESEPEQEPEKEVKEEKPRQTVEERRRNAALRRQREQQAAIDAAVKAEQQRQEAQMLELIGRLGLKVGEEGKPVTDLEGLRAHLAEKDARLVQQELRAGRLTEEILAAVVSNHPAVQKAQQLVEQMEAERQRQETARAQAQIDADIAKIHQVDKSITSLQDLLKAPYGAELQKLVGEGKTLVEAHEQLNRDKLNAARDEAARQAAIRSARGKDHLKGGGTQVGAGKKTVPPGELAMYRLFNPDATEAQIQAFYNKNN